MGITETETEDSVIVTSGQIPDNERKLHPGRVDASVIHGLFGDSPFNHGQGIIEGGYVLTPWYHRRWLRNDARVSKNVATY